MSQNWPSPCVGSIPCQKRLSSCAYDTFAGSNTVTRTAS